MAELFFLILIVSFVVISIRRGKPVVLDAPVIIHRPSQYHITLAPQLNRAQVFIEKIAAQLANIAPPITSSNSVFFSVNDAKICSTGERIFLLAVTARSGLWYFQAILPQPLLHDHDSHYKTMSEFAAAVLLEQPATHVGEANEARICEAVMVVAELAKTPTLQLSKPII